MRTLATIVVILSCVATTSAQSPDEAFHDGAHLFVDGDLGQALAVIDGGLAVAPGHAKLEALKKLIEEEQEQQSGATGSQDQQEQKEEEQEGESEQQNPSEGNQQEDSQEEQGQEQEQSSENGTPPQSDSEQQDAPSESEPRQSNTAGQDNSEELSRAQALRILQALQHEEEQLLREVQKVKGKARRVEKDW